MGHNLDDLQHDMTFTIGGEEFVAHDVDPTVLAKWEDEEAVLSGEEAIKRADEQVIAFLNGDADAVKRYKALRARKKNVVPMWKIGELLRMMMETQTDRPTNTPSPSVAGPGKTAPSSGAE